MTAPAEDTRTRLERTEEELSWAGLALAATLRTGELVVIGLIALLVCPPLAILTVVVVVPLLALALVIGAIAAVIALPVFVVRHLHRHRSSHPHELVHRLAQLGRKDSALAASRVRRLAARAQAKLYVKRDRTVAPPR
jgi:membrane protein implicated in regulation of membrane protease activity